LFIIGKFKMGESLEHQSRQDHETPEQRKPMERFFYKPFKKVDKSGPGLEDQRRAMEEEDQQALSRLDQQLEEADENKLKQRALQFLNKVQEKSGRFIIETSSNGEKCELVVSPGMNILQKNNPRTISQTIEDIEKGKVNTQDLSIEFSTVRFASRELSISYKIPLNKLIAGQTDAFREINNEFGGTFQHARKIEHQAKEQKDLTPEQKRGVEDNGKKITDSLTGRGAEVTTFKQDNIFVISAIMPRSGRQINISTVNILSTLLAFLFFRFLKTLGSSSFVVTFIIPPNSLFYNLIFINYTFLERSSKILATLQTSINTLYSFSRYKI